MNVRACTQTGQKSQGLHTAGNKTQGKPIRAIALAGKTRKQDQYQTGLNTDFQTKQQIKKQNSRCRRHPRNV